MPQYNKLRAAGQGKQDLSVVRLNTGIDQQVTGEQYLKLLERYTMISTWADLIGSLCQHLAIHTHTHTHATLPGNRDHEGTSLQGHLTPHRSRGCRGDHFRSVLKHLPVSLLSVLLLLPPVTDSHLSVCRLCQEGGGSKWSDCSFLNLTKCKIL